jgi:hypothetical protein
MYDRIKHPYDLLLQVAPDAKFHLVASEELPATKTSDKVVEIECAGWQTWQWKPCDEKGGWLVAGHFVDGDGDRLVLCSGADFFLFKPEDLLVRERGPDAIVPSELEEQVREKEAWIKLGMVCLSEQGPDSPAAFLCCGKLHPMIEAMVEDDDDLAEDLFDAADVEDFIAHWHKEADSMGIAFEVERAVLYFIEELKDEAGDSGE